MIYGRHNSVPYIWKSNGYSKCLHLGSFGGTHLPLLQHIYDTFPFQRGWSTVPSLLRYKSTPQGYTTVTNTKTIYLRVIDLRVEHLYSGSCPSTFRKIIGHHTPFTAFFNLTPFLDLMNKTIRYSLSFCGPATYSPSQRPAQTWVRGALRIYLRRYLCTTRHSANKDARIDDPLQDGNFRILHRVMTENRAALSQETGSWDAVAR